MGGLGKFINHMTQTHPNPLFKKKFMTRPNPPTPKSWPNLMGWVGSVLAGRDSLHTPSYGSHNREKKPSVSSYRYRYGSHRRLQRDDVAFSSGVCELSSFFNKKKPFIFPLLRNILLVCISFDFLFSFPSSPIYAIVFNFFFLLFLVILF